MSKLFMRFVILSVRLRPELKEHALGVVLRLCGMKVWDTNVRMFLIVDRGCGGGGCMFPCVES